MYQPYCVIKVAKSPVDEDLKWMLKEPWHCIRATSIRTAYGTTFEVNETDVDLWRPPPGVSLGAAKAEMSLGNVKTKTSTKTNFVEEGAEARTGQSFHPNSSETVLVMDEIRQMHPAWANLVHCNAALYLA